MKRILVAHDGSSVSDGVLEEALVLAAAFDAKIRLVRAVSIPPVPPIMPVPGTRLPIPPVDIDAIIEEAKWSLDRVAKKVPAARSDGVLIGLGPAGQVVLSAAKSYGAELIVIGAHSHGALRRALGTIAARIVERAPVPVLVVRPHAVAQTVRAEPRTAAPDA